MRGYFVAAGMNSVGVLSAGGLGRVVAHWVTTGEPDVDVTGFHVDRFRTHQLEPDYRAARTTEILGTVYAAHTPGKQLRTARNAMLSPVHDRLVAQGGYLREVSGWEGADWFAGEDTTPEAQPTWGRAPWVAQWRGRRGGGPGGGGAGGGGGHGGEPGGRAPWFAQWRAEHETVRERVGLMDMSFMAKFQVTGAGAGAFLDRLSAGAADGDPGVITYTQWLNEEGRIEADLTVSKLDEDDFFVVASDTAHGHVLDRMRRHAPSTVTITDVTAELGQLNVQGPRSRDLLAELTDAD